MTVEGPREVRMAHPVQGWKELKPLALSLLILAGLVLLYHQTALSMAAVWWRNETYAHGMLVLPVSAFLLWRRRKYLATVALGPDARGVVLIALLAGMWLLARQAEVLFIQHLVLVAMVPAGIWAVLGWRFLRAAAFPLAFLLFAVPLGDGLIPWLRNFTAGFTVSALQLTGIPVFREGHYFTIPEGRFLVADACSGLRYLIASLAIGTLFAYLNYRSLWRRLAFLAAAAVVPILANGIRAYGVVVLAHLSDMKLATGIDHLIYGWIFFGVVMALLFWVGGFWREDPDNPQTEKDPGGELRGEAGSGDLGTMGLLAACAVVLAVAAAGPVGAAWIRGEGHSAGPTHIALPKGRAGWQGPISVRTTWHPDFEGADRVIHRAYRHGDREVRVLIIHYGDQRQGRELIASVNTLQDGKRWERIGGKRGDPKLPEHSKGFPVREIHLDGPPGHRLVWQWYDVGGHIASRPVLAKLWGAWERIWNGRSDATLIALATKYDVRPARARKVLRGFLAAYPELTDGGGVVRLGKGDRS